ncbi:MAG: hypothetical protein ACI93T_002261 [Porticoccaceae bacterium]
MERLPETDPAAAGTSPNLNAELNFGKLLLS